MRKGLLFVGLSCFLLSCGHDPSQVKVVNMGLKGTSVGTATVQRNDTLSEIADRYNLSMQSIIVANNLKPPYTIYPSQRLRLPPPKTYTVKPGDTIYDISRMFSTTQTKVVSLNNIQKPYRLRVGQKLKMPLPEDQARVAQAKPAPQSVQKLKRKANLSAPKLSGNGQFAIPVKGKIISSYGPKDGGLHNDGINIAASRGASVGAAQSGVVAYVGNAIEGYGNLVLIKHDKGYMTAYAHLDRVNVKKGQTIAKGQSIGQVGQTGNVSEPQLHFEIRKGTKALNPAVYL